MIIYFHLLLYYFFVYRFSPGMGSIRGWEVPGDQGGERLGGGKHLVTSSVAWRPVSNRDAAQ